MNRELIGRDHAAATLRAAIDRSASHGGLVLVTGEAGIGKTTLITAAATAARQDDTLVLHGACWHSDSAPGFWPWVQIVRALRRELSRAEWDDATRDSGNALARLLGESAEPEKVDDFTLFDAVATLLATASRDRRLLVLLDDLHWADEASLRLLEFVAQHTWFERLLLVGCYRDVEVDPADHPLRPLLMSLAVKATTIALDGLDESAVGQLMAHVVGAEPDSATVSQIHSRTGGNPFFVEQASRLWDSGRDLSVADPGVGETVRHRLALLPTAVATLLAEASVLGQRFHRQLLAALTGDATAHIDRLLEQAITARLMVSCGSGSFAFAHDLVRESLYESLPPARRTTLHAAVVTTVENSPRLAPHVLPAELASHAYRSVDHIGSDQAVGLLVRAAEDAARRVAVAEARGHVTRAVELLDDTTVAPRVREQLRLGSLLHFLQEPDEARRMLTTAVTSARDLDDPALFARAALTFHLTGESREYTQFKNDLLREAHIALTGRHTESSFERIQSELAVRIAVNARRGNDDEALTFGLLARHNSLWGPGTARERLAIMDEVLAVTRRTTDPETEQISASLRWVALLELDDPSYLDQLRACLAAAERSQLPMTMFSARVDVAVFDIQDARFDAAEAGLRTIENSAAPRPGSDFQIMTNHLWWALALNRGDFAAANTHSGAAAAAGHPQPRLLEALTAIESGDVAGALRLAAPLESEHTELPRDLYALWWRLQAQLAAATGDGQRCAQIREVLRPHLGEWLVSLFGCDVNGPATLWMGIVDAAEKNYDSAAEYFTTAARSADRMRMRTWSLRARAGLGWCLLDRDAAAARSMLEEVAVEAETIGMRQLAEWTRGMTAPARDEDEFRADGAVWNLRFDGTAVHLPDSKGLRDLHVLLSHPGQDVPALRLLRPDGGEVIDASQRMGADTVLDEESKARFRQQIERLDAEIERAEQLGDDNKAARFDTERQALLDQLRAATGLGGRDRRLGDDAERARKTVTARIKDAIRKIEKEHPALGEFLSDTVSTGIICRYEPRQDRAWRL